MSGGCQGAREHLGEEGGHRLQPLLRDDGVHRLEDLLVVWLGQLDPREEVGGDAAEERHVLSEEEAGVAAASSLGLPSTAGREPTSKHRA